MEDLNFINKEKGIYIIISLLILINFTGIPNSFSHGADIWVHAAVINELSENFASPKHYFYASENHDHRYSPYLLTMGLIKRALSLDIFTVIFLASLINLLIFLIGVYYFTREYFNDKTVAIYILPIMLFFWGAGIGHSNEYSFRILTISLSYPSIFAFSCSLIVFYFILKYLRTNKKTDKIGYYIISVIMGTIIFLSHPFTGSFLFLTIIVLMLSEKTDLKNKILLLSFPVIVLSIAFLWPYYSWCEVIVPQVLSTVPLIEAETSSDHVPVFYSLSSLLRVGLVLLVGTIIMLKLFFNEKYEEKYKFIYYGGILFLLIYIIFGIFTIKYGGRYLYFYIFFLHLAIAAEFAERRLFSLDKLKFLDKFSLFSLDRINKRRIIDIILIGAFLLSLIIHLGLMYAPHFVDNDNGKLKFHGYVSYKYHEDFNEYKFLENIVLHYDVVLSDPKTSFVIPTYSGKVVYADGRDMLFEEVLKNESYNECNTECNTESNDAGGIYKDIVCFFQSNTSSTVRECIIDRYNISYILINHNLPIRETTISKIKNLGDTTYSSEYFTLVKVENVKSARQVR